MVLHIPVWSDMGLLSTPGEGDGLLSMGVFKASLTLCSGDSERRVRDLQMERTDLRATGHQFSELGRSLEIL